MPDGLRINWHVTEGSFVGAGLDARVLPGATDWMRIRKDGVGVVNVNACIETRSGSRIYSSYGGTFDLGRRGLRACPPQQVRSAAALVVTPTYATSDAQFAWLNRAQCIGVGRVDMKAMRVEYDVYVIQVGARKNAD